MRRFLAALAVLMLLSSPVWAGGYNDEVRTVLDLMEGAYSTLGSLEASFVQSEDRPGVGVTSVEEGSLFFLPPDRMRWDYMGKRPHSVIINDDLVWIYTPSRKQIVRRKMSIQEMRMGPATFMRGISGLTKQFDVQSVEESLDGGYLLDLFPKDGQTSYDKIGILVSAKTGLLERIRIHHRLGNLTTIKFSNIKTGVKLSSKLFKWDVPDGVEVIEP